jgi:hypothetical protein
LTESYRLLALRPGEIEDMARSYIAVSTGQSIDNIAVRIIGSRWWKRAKRHA